MQEKQVKEQQQLDTALARMARFREEMARTTGPGPTVGAAPEDPTPTQPGKIPELVAELDRLRVVAEMEIEREEVRKKRSRSLSVPSPDLVGCFARSGCWSAPGCAHGNFDQSWKHSGSVELIQPVGVTQGHIRHTGRVQHIVCEVYELGRQRTQVPIVEGGKFPVKVQSLDLQGWWERLSITI